MTSPADHDAFASVLVDFAESVRIAPRMLPEDIGPDNRYRLEELIGIGHDSHVYRAIDRHLSKPALPAQVAIKIRATKADTRIEAIIGRSVSHTNVVGIIDYGELDDGTTYIVQEWVPGGDLGDLSLPLAPREAAGMVASVARGLQALHSAGNIHGDLKPANILRDSEGIPKIADFDMASATDLETATSGGNIAFMPPERVLESQNPPTPAGDIFALGCMLYYFLTGVLPFGASVETIRARHCEQLAPDFGGLETDLAHICRLAMHHDRTQRYSSPEMLAGDLDLWAARRPLGWTKPSPVRRASLLWRRHPLGVLLVAVLVASVVAAGGWVRSSMMRDLDARRQAVGIAEAEIEEQRALMRGSLKQFVQSGVAGNRNRNGASVFEALAWVDMLAHTPVLGKSGPLMARSERITSLLRVRDEQDATRQRGSLTDSMAAYSLAYCYIESGEPDKAAAQLDDARSGVFDSLSEADEARECLHAMDSLIEFQRIGVQDDARAKELREELGALQREFAWNDSSHSVSQLIKAVLSQ